ncbi:MAG: arginine deiminase [Bacteroidales bacterium]|jgi:arginine deiminase|nr:arginine deiminase [Bacteroidales bacterium]
MINLNSEIGRLKKVILHRPGREIELMKPEDIQGALYSDILNKEIAQTEYAGFENIIQHFIGEDNALYVENLLADCLATGEKNNRNDLIETLCESNYLSLLKKYLLSVDDKELLMRAVKGVRYKSIGLKTKEFFALFPLYNLYFTRDTAMAVNNAMVFSNMQYAIRQRERNIIKYIFEHHPNFKNENKISLISKNPYASIAGLEGGDLHVLRHDLYLIGLHPRTNHAGVEAFINSRKGKKSRIITFELPSYPASFIHLDMVFTMINYNDCVVYAPLIFDKMQQHTSIIDIDGEKVKYKSAPDIVKAIAMSGIDLKPICCGGEKELNASREQWHSGANFFCLAPGVIMGYGRNRYTMDELAKAGYNIVVSSDVDIEQKITNVSEKTVFTIEGNELSRGGGGCRCMTMPICRE